MLNKTYILLLGVLTALSITTHVNAADCPLLKLQQMRSSGTDVSGSHCPNKEDLSVDSVLSVAPGARFWLESSVNNPADIAFQLICQNKSSHSITLKVAQASQPWLQADASLKCSPWQSNRLACSEANGDANALMCALSAKKTSHDVGLAPGTANVVALDTRTSSVTVRGIGSHKNVDPALEPWMAMLKSEIDLCRAVSDSDQPITLSWELKANGQVKGAVVKNTGVDSKFAACSLDALHNFSFPKIDKDTYHVTSAF